MFFCAKLLFYCTQLRFAQLSNKAYDDDDDLTQCGQGQGIPASHVSPDPSNRLATIHERYRQDRTDRLTGQRDNGLMT